MLKEEGKTDLPFRPSSQLLALAIFSGLWSAYSDAQWSYYWAKYREKVERQESNSNDAENISWSNDVGLWHKQKRWSERAAILFFVTGVLMSSIYIALRAF